MFLCKYKQEKGSNSLISNNLVQKFKVQSLDFVKFLRTVSIIRHHYFPLNFAKFLRTIFLIEHSYWLLQKFTVNV